MNFLIDYHILFVLFIFILFVLTLLLLFVIEPTVESTVGCLIMIMVNIILCIIVSLSFGIIDVPGVDSTGEIVHNIVSDMYFFGWFFLGLVYVNFMLSIYCGYIFWKKPWEDYQATGAEESMFV